MVCFWIFIAIGVNTVWIATWKSIPGCSREGVRNVIMDGRKRVRNVIMHGREGVMNIIMDGSEGVTIVWVWGSMIIRITII